MGVSNEKRCITNPPPIKTDNNSPIIIGGIIGGIGTLIGIGGIILYKKGIKSSR